MTYSFKSNRKARRRDLKLALKKRRKFVNCSECSKSHPHGKKHKCGSKRKVGPNKRRTYR